MRFRDGEDKSAQNSDRVAMMCQGVSVNIFASTGADLNMLSSGKEREKYMIVYVYYCVS